MVVMLRLCVAVLGFYLQCAAVTYLIALPGDARLLCLVVLIARVVGSEHKLWKDGVHHGSTRTMPAVA